MSALKKIDSQKSESTTEKTTPTEVKKNKLHIQQLLKGMLDNGASDLHLTPSSPPVMRINGEIISVKSQSLIGKDIQDMIFHILNEKQKKDLMNNYEIDFSFGIKSVGRFRGTIYRTKGELAAAFRFIPGIVPEFSSLGLPDSILDISDVPNGLILVTGPTGSGKSTTLAAIMNWINVKKRVNIVTLEDPIEFLHKNKNSIVNQREIGGDVESFQSGLRALLRQDPDVVLIGELRDAETIEAALTTAETGHLVFATLHTNSTIQSINRMINVFPGEKQGQIRSLLSFTLQGVIAQQLIPKASSPELTIALELLIPNSGIRNLIRDNKLHQVYSQMQIGQGESGMMTMNQSLFNLIQKRHIDEKVALGKTTMPDELAKMLGLKIEEDFS